jgi:hypothetical protein
LRKPTRLKTCVAKSENTERFRLIPLELDMTIINVVGQALTEKKTFDIHTYNVQRGIRTSILWTRPFPFPMPTASTLRSISPSTPYIFHLAKQSYSVFKHNKVCDWSRRLDIRVLNFFFGAQTLSRLRSITHVCRIVGSSRPEVQLEHFSPPPFPVRKERLVLKPMK